MRGFGGEGCRVWGEGCRVWGEGCRVWGEGCRVWGEGCRVWSEGCRVWGEGCRVQRGRVHLNPEGIAASSPRLDAAGGLPWVRGIPRSDQPQRGCAGLKRLRRMPQPRWGCGLNAPRFPRVGRLRRHAFPSTERRNRKPAAPPQPHQPPPPLRRRACCPHGGPSCRCNLPAHRCGLLNGHRWAILGCHSVAQGRAVSPSGFVENCGAPGCLRGG